jgi:predicted lipid-binding transport protein (Tim44 family)
MRKRAILAAMLLVLIASVPAWARGGGGCFLPESKILRSDGTEIPIRAIRPGDDVLAYSPEGRIVHTKVRNVVRHKVDEYIILKTDRQTLRVTTEHPFYVGHGTFKTLDALQAGDALFVWDGQSLSRQIIVSQERVRERVRVFNLQTDHPNTFFAAGIAVHNKGGGGGCFPAGTMIRSLSGQVPIETLSTGDMVRAVDPEGKLINARVEKLFAIYAHVFLVETNRGLLRATMDHPVGLQDGTFIEAGKLQPGHKVLFWDDGALRPATVIGTSTRKREELVYNLSVNQPHTFLAADFLVHNKGGSSSHSSSSSRSSSSSSSRSSQGTSSDDTEEIIGGIIFCTLSVGLVIGFILIKKRKSKKSENLDYVYSPLEVAKKSKKTEKLLEFLSRQDPSLLPEELRKLAESIFSKLQECWGKREYGPMKPLLMHDLFLQHTSQLQGLVRNHEINRIDELKIERVDLVNVRYTEKPDQREFTALITASARDYYIDDRTDKFLRGDKSPARFQEFWTFHRAEDDWLLREIEQSGESDVLKEENFVEMLTDQTIQRIYGDVDNKEGTAGPWLERGTEEKATRIDRLLNFLVQTDKLWDRQQMLERARQVFLKVFLAQESGDPEQVSDADLFRDVAESLHTQIMQQQTDGITVEYRNICVRKAELILVRNFTDPSKDEFTVRISAHAQKIMHKGRQTLNDQRYVTPFEEYWTFGRMDGNWKLKEVLPPARGEKMIAEENVDEESSTGQMNWYYRQTRAT